MLEGWWERGVGGCGCGGSVVFGLDRRGCCAGLGGVLQDGHEKFDEEGGGERGDAGAGYGALLVEGCVA